MTIQTIRSGLDAARELEHALEDIPEERSREYAQLLQSCCERLRALDAEARSISFDLMKVGRYIERAMVSRETH